MERATVHKKRRQVSVTLEAGLRDDFGKRSLPLRSGDEVEVMRGDWKGLTSDVREIDTKKGKVILEDLQEEKVDGTEVHPPVDPSNLRIVAPDLSDPMREKAIERSGGEVKEELKEVEEEEEAEEEETEEEEKPEEGFQCEICGDTFTSKRGRNIHKGKSHPEYMK